MTHACLLPSRKRRSPSPGRLRMHSRLALAMRARVSRGTLRAYARCVLAARQDYEGAAVFLKGALDIPPGALDAEAGQGRGDQIQRVGRRVASQTSPEFLPR